MSPRGGKGRYDRRGRFRKQRSVAEWKEHAKERVAKLNATGKPVHPVLLEGSTISKTFWGKAWCKHLEAYSDYENRLPRGRSYVRHNSVLDLELLAPDPEAGRPTGRIHALVDGRRISKVTLKVVPLSPERWEAIKSACAGEIDSLIELLNGKLSEAVLEIVTQPGTGLFPSSDEIDLRCSCPDWASMCKHIAASLYGIGARLDTQPEMLFKLRGVDPAELVEGAMEHNTGAAPSTQRPTLTQAEQLAIFGDTIDFDALESSLASQPRVRAPRRTPKSSPPPVLPARANRLLALIKKQPGLRTKALIKGIRSRPYATSKALKQLKQHGLVEFRGPTNTGGYFAIE